MFGGSAHCEIGFQTIENKQPSGAAMCGLLSCHPFSSTPSCPAAIFGMSLDFGSGHERRHECPTHNLQSRPVFRGIRLPTSYRQCAGSSAANPPTLNIGRVDLHRSGCNRLVKISNDETRSYCAAVNDYGISFGRAEQPRRRDRLLSRGRQATTTQCPTLHLDRVI